MMDVDGIETLGDMETPGTETFGDIIMQKLDDQDNFDLGNDGTCFEFIVEKVLALDDLDIETSILYLNNQIVDLE